MKYKIVISRTSKEVTLDNLSRNLKLHSEIYSIQEDGEVYLGPISHKTLVFFAVEFADYALKNYAKKENPSSETCIALTRKWLEDRESVSNEDLRAAANAANAAYAAANAAYAYAAAVANATYVAANVAAYAAADASYAAANAAYAAASYAAYAAYAAADAAAYAADAAGKDREREFERQGEFILDFLKSGKHLFLV
jgi:hypothetical protein